MALITDLNPAAILLNPDNPMRQSAERVHLNLLDTAGRAARVHFDFTDAMLDLNRRSVEALYDSGSIRDALSSQSKLAGEARGLASRYASELKGLAGHLLRPTA
jgi:hypothetical protein